MQMPTFCSAKNCIRQQNGIKRARSRPKAASFTVRTLELAKVCCQFLVSASFLATYAFVPQYSLVNRSCRLGYSRCSHHRHGVHIPRTDAVPVALLATLADRSYVHIILMLCLVNLLIHGLPSLSHFHGLFSLFLSFFLLSLCLPHSLCSLPPLSLVLL